MERDEYARMDEVEGRMWWYRALHARLLAALAAVRGRVLDAGSGTGGLLAVLQASRPDLTLTGLEAAEHACGRAARKSNAALVCGSVNAMPFDTACFDAAVSADVLCHAAVEPHRALAELKRVLRPGGRLIINMPAYTWLTSVHDRRVHNIRRTTARQTACELRQAGFQRIQAHYWNGLLLPLMVVHRKLMSRGSDTSDVAVFPPWLNAILYEMTEMERRLPMSPLAGGSVLAIAERS